MLTHLSTSPIPLLTLLPPLKIISLNKFHFPNTLPLWAVFHDHSPKSGLCALSQYKCHLQEQMENTWQVGDWAPSYWNSSWKEYLRIRGCPVPQYFIFLDLLYPRKTSINMSQITGHNLRQYSWEVCIENLWLYKFSEDAEGWDPQGALGVQKSAHCFSVHEIRHLQRLSEFY